MAYSPPPLVDHSESPWKEEGQNEEARERAPLLTETQADRDNGRAQQPPASSTERLQSDGQRAPPAASTAPPPEMDLPDPQTFWQEKRNRYLLYWCFFCSTLLVILALGQPFLFLALLSGFMGIAVTITHLIPRVSVDISVQNSKSTVLCLTGFVLSMVSLLQLAWVMFLTNVECRLDPTDAPAKDCVLMYSYIGAGVVLVLANAVMFQTLMLRTNTLNRLLNPVSSGMVALA